MKIEKLGVMGGTFDPIHLGHLFLAEEARQKCGLDKVWFVPNSQPAHIEGKTALATPETRAELVELAIADNPNFAVSRLEIERGGKSYAFDTIGELKSQTGAQIFWILGADAIGEVLTWYRGAELFEMCRFIAASRPEFDLGEAKNRLGLDLASRVEWLEIPGLHIASREIRRRVLQRETIRYLVAESARQRIEAIYSGKAVKNRL